MVKLLNAGFIRLRKNKLFLLLIIFSIGLELFMICTMYSDVKVYGDNVELEQIMLNYSTIIGIVMAIFISLFLGVEYSDGTIRNKISMGHNRTNIYLSNFIIVTITSLFSYILFIITVAIIGTPLFGGITISTLNLLVLLGCIFITIIAYSSIFTFIAMTVSNKTTIAIVNIMLAFGMMIVALTCFNKLEAPEKIQTGSLTDAETGEMEWTYEPNPKYPSEGEKRVYQTLADINPAGQMYQIAGRAFSNLKIFPIYSLGIVIVFSIVGIVLFNKKELK